MRAFRAAKRRGSVKSALGEAGSTGRPSSTIQLTYSDFFCRLLVDASLKLVNCCCRLPARPGLPRLPVLSATVRLLFVRDPLPVDSMCGWISVWNQKGY